MEVGIDAKQKCDSHGLQVKLAWFRDQVDLALRFADNEDYSETDLKSFSRIAEDLNVMLTDIKVDMNFVNRVILKKIQDNQQWLG